jgi:mRNA-degrading endonuclease YafQ of YafQ-DinJ toxin-antitoxin module
MWHVKIEEKAAEIFESDELTDDDKVVIQTWAQTVAEHGPNELQKRPSVWADHALHGEWQGYRSSSFSYKGRIIYKVKDNIVTVIVVRITTDHDYKKKRE